MQNGIAPSISDSGAHSLPAAQAPTHTALGQGTRESGNGFFGPLESGSYSSSTAIRAIVGRWLGNANDLDAAAKQRGLAERDSFVRAVCRLFDAGCKHAVDGVWRTVRAADVELTLTLLRRLSLVQRVSLDEVTSWCVAQAERDNNPFAHCTDPFQTRFIMGFHTAGSGAESSSPDLHRLKTACLTMDIDAIRKWFDALEAPENPLPMDIGQRLRFLLLELWEAGANSLELAAFEAATVEARMFDAMGWENMRYFCALLKRMGGSTSKLLSSYLNDEDIDEAMLLNEDLGNDDECAYYRTRAAEYSTETLRALQRAVFKASQRVSTPPFAAVATPAPASRNPFLAAVRKGFPAAAAF